MQRIFPNQEHFLKLWNFDDFPDFFKIMNIFWIHKHFILLLRHLFFKIHNYLKFETYMKYAINLKNERGGRHTLQMGCPKNVCVGRMWCTLATYSARRSLNRGSHHCGSDSPSGFHVPERNIMQAQLVSVTPTCPCGPRAPIKLDLFCFCLVRRELWSTLWCLLLLGSVWTLLSVLLCPF